jgi:TolB-like protein/Flp pilus assembly protein TadD
MSKGTQRRLTTIVAADIAGFSRLVGIDEEATLLAQRGHRSELIEPLLSEHNGRIANTAGDSFLFEFPSAVEAVRCSMALQNGMTERNQEIASERRIQFRIGINVGDVVADGNDLLGDGVNIAARLETLCTPGSIILSDDAYRQVRDRLDVNWEDGGEHEVKNIARPIQVWLWVKPTEVKTLSLKDDQLRLPDKPSIAVLPFDNMSGDADQAYFADGITEDIITELSRFRSLFIIARNSSFAFRDQSVDIMEVGRQLGVRYVVEGSVRKAGNRIRVTAQLIEASSGHHLWAERYDRELEDIFAVQDEITRAIVSVVPVRVEEAVRELTERNRTPSWSAYDFILVGNDRFKRFTREGVAEARRMFEKSLEIDPTYARAHANLAWTHVASVFLEWSSDDSLDDALEHAEIALTLDNEDGWSHGVLAQALFLARRDEEAQIHFRRALALNPNDADIAAFYANILVYWGRVDKAIEWIAIAKRLNPFYPNLYLWYEALAFYSAQEYERAVLAIREMQSLDLWNHGLLAACYAQMGRIDEARNEMKKFTDERQSELTKRGEHVPRNNLDLALVRADRYRIPTHREHFLDGLHKAGLGE